jgi:hypothetical protein
MAISGIITIADTTTASITSFDLYSCTSSSNSSCSGTAFATNVSRASLLDGYCSDLIPDGTTYIKVNANSGACQNINPAIVELSGVPIIPTSTPTPTPAAPTPTPTPSKAPGSGLTAHYLSTGSTYAEACANFSIHTDPYYVYNDATLQAGNVLCQNNNCSTKALNGYYSDGTNYWLVGDGVGGISAGPTSCSIVDITTIDLGGVNCRLVGSCNDNGTCSVRYNINFANGRPSATQVFVQPIGSNTASVAVYNDLGNNTDVYLDYSESNGSQSINFRLILKSFPSGNEICRSGDLTLNHNHGGAPWNMISACSSGTSGTSGSSGGGGTSYYSFTVGTGYTAHDACADAVNNTLTLYTTDSANRNLVDQTSYYSNNSGALFTSSGFIRFSDGTNYGIIDQYGVYYQTDACTNLPVLGTITGFTYDTQGTYDYGSDTTSYVTTVTGHTNGVGPIIAGVSNLALSVKVYSANRDEYAYVMLGGTVGSGTEVVGEYSWNGGYDPYILTLCFDQWYAQAQGNVDPTLNCH